MGLAFIRYDYWSDLSSSGLCGVSEREWSADAVELLNSENARVHFRFATRFRKSVYLWKLHSWFLAQKVIRSEICDEKTYEKCKKKPPTTTDCCPLCFHSSSGFPNDFRDICAAKFTQVTNQCILSRTGESRTLPGVVTVLVKMQTCVSGQYLGNKT